MLRSLKIIPAILICLAIIYRLLFINIDIISSSSDTQQNKIITKTHFSSIMKRKQNVEPSDNSINIGYSIVEICEEASDEDFQLKSNIFFPLQILYSFVSKGIEQNTNKFPSYTDFSCTSSQRYLINQVFRI
jgi:hypothetical protein